MATTVSDDLNAREYEELVDDEATVRSKVFELAKLVQQHAGRVVFVTGAGISTGAGVPDFRSGVNSVTGLPAGKWCRQATEDKWTDEQAECQRVRAAKAVPTTKAVPTRSHMALVALQKAGVIRGVISQNTDGLHRSSGLPPKCLAELHGNSTIEYCGWCGKEYLRDYAASLGRHLSGKTLKRDLWAEHSKLDLINPRRGNHYTGRRCQVEGCDGWLFDSTIDFGDNLPDDHFERGEALARESTLCIVLGSRCAVSPASDLPRSIGESTEKIGGNQKTLVVVNLQRTEVDDCATLRIGAKIDDVMVGLMAELGKAEPASKTSWKILQSRQRSIWPPSRAAAANLAEIPPFTLRRRIRVKHTTALTLQRQALESLDAEQYSAKQMSVAIGKFLRLKDVGNIAPRAVVKAARTKIKQQMEGQPVAAPVADAWEKVSPALPAVAPGSGEMKSELLKIRDVLLTMLASGTISANANYGGGKVEVNAVDSDGVEPADVLWNVKVVPTTSTTALTATVGDESSILASRNMHVELTHDIKRKGAGGGERGLGKHPASDRSGFRGAARGDTARVLSYPWEDHSTTAKGCGYGRVRLEMLSGAGASNRWGGSRRQESVSLTVGADMCAVLQGPSNSGKGEGPQLTHTIRLDQASSKLSAAAATTSVPTCDSVASAGDSLSHGIGLLLCFRAHYGEPPCMLPLPTAATGVESPKHRRLEPKPEPQVDDDDSDAPTQGVYSYEYLMEWCPGLSTEWKVIQK